MGGGERGRGVRERRRQSVLPSDPEEGDASEVSWAGKRKGGQLAWIDGYSLLRQPFPAPPPPLVHRVRAVRLWDFLLYIVSVLSLEFLLYIVSVLSLGLPIVHRFCVVCQSGTSCCTWCPCCLSLGLPVVHRARVVCLWDFLLYIVSILSVSATSSCTASLYCLSLRLPLVQRVCTVCLCDFLLYSRRVCTVCLWDILLYRESVLSFFETSSCTRCLYSDFCLPLVQVSVLRISAFLLYTTYDRRGCIGFYFRRVQHFPFCVLLRPSACRRGAGGYGTSEER